MAFLNCAEFVSAFILSDPNSKVSNILSVDSLTDILKPGWPSLRTGSQAELRTCIDDWWIWISASQIVTRNSHWSDAWSDAIIYMFPLSSIYVNCWSTMHKKHINWSNWSCMAILSQSTKCSVLRKQYLKHLNFCLNILYFEKQYKLYGLNLVCTV
jgi:hypothetical protein